MEKLINLRNLLSATGSISVAEFMESVIASKDGYYNNIPQIGKNGDFITAPELSQLFGEMIAIWLYLQWDRLGRPKNYALTELGPGHGTLMKDILKTFRSFQDFTLPQTIFFVEISQSMISHQKQLIKQFPEIEFKWIDSVYLLPDQVNIIIGNEFFDAMPIKQYIKNKNDWYEINLSLAPENADFRFIEIGLEREFSDYLNKTYKFAKHRSVVEESPKSIDIIKFITSKLITTGGRALFIDYGYYQAPDKRKAFNSTIQAVKEHKYHPILQDIGKADLSAHVDFWTLEQAAQERGAKTRVISQREFLIENGIEVRTSMLVEKAKQEDKKILSESFHRLTDNAQMGKLFKALILTFDKV